MSAFTTSAGHSRLKARPDTQARHTGRNVSDLLAESDFMPALVHILLSRDVNKNARLQFIFGCLSRIIKIKLVAFIIKDQLVFAGILVNSPNDVKRN